MNNSDLRVALLKPYDLMSDEEFDAVTYFERWCSINKRRTIQTVHISEALQIFTDDVYEICMAKIGNGEQIDHFNNVLWKLKKWRSGDVLQVDQAKKVNIENLIRSYGYEPRMNKIQCPFHGEERTPSLHIYTNTNTWHCFGCGAGSDTIDWVMKKGGVNFVQAVKYLSNS
mgnify:CR=1 FL=1